MKFSLTITDANPSELSALLASFGGSTAINIQPQPSTAPVVSGDDDDNAPANTNAPAVDSTGLPHDERIHSAAKTLTATGAWRKRKGVSDATVAAVEAELRARGGNQQPPQVTQSMPLQMPQQQPPMQMPPQQPMQQPQTQPGYPTGPGYPQQPGNVVAGGNSTLAQSMPYQQPPMQMPPQQPMQQPQTQPGTMDFNTFMGYLTQKMSTLGPDNNPIVGADYIMRMTAEISQQFNTQLNVITDISGNPAMIASAIQIMSRDGKW